MTHYRAILFDLDDTLLDFQTCESNALESAFRLICPVLGSDWKQIWATYEPISRVHWRSRNKITREGVVERSIRDALLAIGRTAEAAPALAQEYWSIFCRTGYLRDGAQETLKGLSEHYCLGVVTNGYADAQRGRLKAAGLLSCFDVVLISEEAGYTKPDGRIFECAMRELGVVPAETLFVGDSVEHDYYGALNAGIDFCYYRTGKDSTNFPVRPTFEIGALPELADLLLSPI